MIRLLAILALYSLMVPAWIGVGLFMLVAPVRFGNLIHDSFGILPELNTSDRTAKIVIRLTGIALIVFAIHYALAAADLIRRA